MERPEYVSLIEAVGLGYIKVGRALNPFQRMTELQTGCPKPLRLLACVYVKDAAGYERRIHELLERYRSHGEWFDVDACFFKKFPLHSLAIAMDDQKFANLSVELARREIPF